MLRLTPARSGSLPLTPSRSRPGLSRLVPAYRFVQLASRLGPLSFTASLASVLRHCQRRAPNAKQGRHPATTRNNASRRKITIQDPSIGARGKGLSQSHGAESRGLREMQYFSSRSTAIGEVRTMSDARGREVEDDEKGRTSRRREEDQDMGAGWIQQRDIGMGPGKESDHEGLFANRVFATDCSQ